MSRFDATVGRDRDAWVGSSHGDGARGASVGVKSHRPGQMGPAGKHPRDDAAVLFE